MHEPQKNKLQQQIEKGEKHFLTRYTVLLAVCIVSVIFIYQVVFNHTIVITGESPHRIIISQQFLIEMAIYILCIPIYCFIISIYLWNHVKNRYEQQKHTAVYQSNSSFFQKKKLNIFLITFACVLPLLLTWYATWNFWIPFSLVLCTFLLGCLICVLYAFSLIFKITIPSHYQHLKHILLGCGIACIALGLNSICLYGLHYIPEAEELISLLFLTGVAIYKYPYTQDGKA